MAIDVLYDYMRIMLGYTPTANKRYLYERIDWDCRMIGIVGPRGVGKSTMLQQFVIDNMDIAERHPKYLYVAADHLWFANHTIVELADEFVKNGGEHLLIDEVHKYKGWSQELKQIYDVYAKLQIVFTGSSILDIRDGEADLSRRVLMYNMQGMSFREYLNIFHGQNIPTYTLETILGGNISIPIAHPLPLFRNYLAEGYYPFARDGHFPMRMQTIVSQTIEQDIAQYANLKASTARKLKRLVGIISEMVPFKPNFDSLSTEIGVSKNNIPDYFTYFERAGILAILRHKPCGLRELGKIEKVYIDNPSLMTALAGGAPNIGSLREVFFMNQMRINHNVVASDTTDFEIGGYSFEIGGRKKGKKQIEGLTDAFVVKDDIEFAQGNIIPLWYFGLNY